MYITLAMAQCGSFKKMETMRNELAGAIILVLGIHFVDPIATDKHRTAIAQQQGKSQRRNVPAGSPRTRQT